MTSAQPASVDFFDRQDAARSSSTKLVILFLVAVVCIVAVINAVVYAIVRDAPASTQVTWLVVATVLTVLIIGGGTLSKIATLRSGGAAVALSVGAVPVDLTTTDPQLRRFVNVVEEMSIASAVPLPPLFALPREQGINAFVAGYSPYEAAVTVTARALERLNRDEVQGVIGHAFSRQAFNDAVLKYNNQRETFPTSVLAGMFHFTPAALWEIEPDHPETREAPKVQF